MRPFYWKNKKKIPVYASSKTIKELENKYTFCFKKRHGYKPIMKANIIKKRFKITNNNYKIDIEPFEVTHGMIKSTGYLFDKIAYISDCNCKRRK